MPRRPDQSPQKKLTSAPVGALRRTARSTVAIASAKSPGSWLADKFIAILALLLSCYSVYQTLVPTDDVRLQTIGGRNAFSASSGGESAFIVKDGMVGIPIVIANLGTANAIVYDTEWLYRFDLTDNSWFEFTQWGETRNRHWDEPSVLIEPRNVKVLDLQLPEADMRNELTNTDGYSPYQLGLRIRYITSSGVFVSKEFKVGEIKVLRDKENLLIEQTYPPLADLRIDTLTVRLKR